MQRKVLKETSSAITTDNVFKEIQSMIEKFDVKTTDYAREYETL